MKWIKMIFCFAVIISLTASCIKYNLYDDNGNPVYKDYYHAIQFSYPEGWQVETKEGDGSIYVVPAEYSGDNKPQIRLGVVYDKKSDEKSNDENLEEYINDIKNTYLDVEIIGFGTKENTAGNSTQYVKYKYTDSSGKHFYASDRIVDAGALTLFGLARCDQTEGELYDKHFDITLDTLTVFSN
ncbi:MAG: hypothetical protein IJL87_03030 [Clostridia bacterium]|nr:hypothetical protein [Clostridia bacterium]